MRIRTQTTTIALIGLCLAAGLHGQDVEPQDELQELIVLLAAEPEAPAPEALVTAINARVLTGAFVQAPPESAQPALIHRAQGAQRARLLAAPDTPRARLERYVVLRYPPGTDLEAAVPILEADPRVLHVEPNRRIRFHVEPSDPFFPITPDPADHQWGLHIMSLPAAWDRIKGNAYLGLVDVGLDVDHEDLRPFATHVVQGDECSYLAGSFEGGNFRPHLSFDFGDGDCNVDDGLKGHGTHVAGIVAATTDNDKGVAGHCWHCPIMMIKTTPASTEDAFYTNAANGLTFLVDKGAQSASMSFGVVYECPGTGGLGMLCDAVAHATMRDVVLAASDGNDKTDIEFPASDDRVIAVGGVQPAGAIWDEETVDTFLCPCDRPGFCEEGDENCEERCEATPTFECGSNFMVTPGTAEQDLVAPARTVVSTFPPFGVWNADVGCTDAALPPDGDGYGLCTGTSMSSPAVSAIAGLVRSANPLLLRDQVKSLLVDHASMAGSGDPMFGNGIPDADASVAAALGTVADQTLKNRLTPLFNLWSPEAETHLSTTIPQQVQAALFDPEVTFETLYEGDLIPGYTKFPDQPRCPIGPCQYDPRAYVYVFSTYVEPFPGSPELVPLYRMSFDEDFGGNPLNRSYFYTTEILGIENFKVAGYRLDGIEGYIYKRCTPEPSCIPAGATRLYRLYHFARDDYAIFPESKLAQFQADGYVGQPPGLNDWIGYVYELVDTDGDHVIDGFEGLIGTDPADPDSDDDGLTDGEEILGFPYSDPLDEPSCDLVFADSFDSGDFGNWSSTAIIGNATLDVNFEAAMEGPFGMQATVQGAGDRAFVRDQTPAGETVYRARFLFRFRARMSDGNLHRILSIQDASPAANVAVVDMQRSGNLYRLRARVRRDNLTWATTPWINLEQGPAPFEIEVLWRASDAFQANGSLDFVVNQQILSLTGIDNDSFQVDRTYLGLVNGVDALTQGDFYFDAFESCRD